MATSSDSHVFYPTDFAQAVLQRYSFKSALLFGLTLTITYFVVLCIYRIFFHPLARYPGPFLGKITEWNVLWPTLRGDNTFTRHRWLKKYGDIVRCGPNELMFGDIHSVKDIYGQTARPCPKDPAFYGDFSASGAPNVVSICDRAEHTRIRRLVSQGLSLRHLVQSQKEIATIIQNFLRVAETAPQPVNLYPLVNRLFLDILSKLSFGRSFNCLDGEHEAESKANEAIGAITVVRLWCPWIEYVPLKVIKDAIKARETLLNFARRGLADVRASIAGRKNPEPSILEKLIKARDEETGDTLSEEELVENAVILLATGSGTTISFVLYFLYEVTTHPHVKEKLVREIREAFPDKSKFPEFDEINKLPYLSKAWDENLRLRNPLPIHQPRISPGKVIANNYVPEGIRVSNLAYATHMHPEIFPQPHEFIPERWDNPTEHMKLAFRPFSTGPHNCVGMYLARVQGLMTVAGIYQRYDLTVDPQTTPEMMEPGGYGHMEPKTKNILFHVKKAAK